MCRGSLLSPSCAGSWTPPVSCLFVVPLLGCQRARAAGGWVLFIIRSCRRGWPGTGARGHCSRSSAAPGGRGAKLPANGISCFFRGVQGGVKICTRQECSLALFAHTGPRSWMLGSRFVLSPFSPGPLSCNCSDTSLSGAPNRHHQPRCSLFQ